MTAGLYLLFKSYLKLPSPGQNALFLVVMGHSINAALVAPVLQFLSTFRQLTQ